MSFICHIHNYTEYNQQWNVFSAFNPSKCTHTHTWSSEQPTLRRPGSSWGFGALLKGLTSVVDDSCQSRDSNSQPRVTSQTLYPLEPRLPDTLGVFPGNWTHNCAANAMLYHWATGTYILKNVGNQPVLVTIDFHLYRPKTLIHLSKHLLFPKRKESRTLSEAELSLQCFSFIVCTWLK